MTEIEKLLKELEIVQKGLAKALPEAIEKAKKEVATADSMLARLEALRAVMFEHGAGKSDTKAAVRTTRRKKKEVKVGSIGKQLRDIRKRQNLSQKEAAKLSKVAQPTLCNIELGKTMPSGKTIEKLAKAFPDLVFDASPG